jgi:hypothetical protein
MQELESGNSTKIGKKIKKEMKVYFDRWFSSGTTKSIELCRRTNGKCQS